MVATIISRSLFWRLLRRWYFVRKRLEVTTGAGNHCDWLQETLQCLAEDIAADRDNPVLWIVARMALSTARVVSRSEYIMLRNWLIGAEQAANEGEQQAAIWTLQQIEW